MKRDIKNIILIVLLISYALVYRFIILKDFLKYSLVITATFLLVLFFISYLFFDFSKYKNNMVKLESTINVMLIVVGYFVVYYIFGMFMGFLKNSYSLKLLGIIHNSIFPLLSIIFIELLRYNFVRSNSDKKKYLVLFCITLIIFEVLINLNLNKSYDGPFVFGVITNLIIPICFRNFLLTYITYELGYLPAIMYSSLTQLYIYFAAIIPDTGDYLNSLFSIILPSVVFVFTYNKIKKYYNKDEKYTINNNRTKFNKYDIPYIVVILLLIVLVSGIFRFKILGIVSASMYPEIKKGDAVIIDNNFEEISEGDIIVYKNNNKSIVHRVVEIKDRNNKTYYITKGDNNNTEDDVDITIDDIDGKVIVTIPFIAYPAVYISELFG